MCTVTAKARNVPGNEPSPTDDDDDDDDASSILSGHIPPLIKVYSFHQWLHNSCETQHDHNYKSAVYTDRLASFPFLHLSKLQCVTTTEQPKSWV